MYSPSLTFTTIAINISLKKISASARFLVLSMSTYLTLTGIPMCRMPSVWRPMSTWRQRLSKLVCSDTGWLPSHTNSGQNSLVSCVSMCPKLFIICSMPSTLTLFNCRPAWNDWISMLRACFCDVYMPITAIVIVTSTLYVIFALYPEERENKMKIFLFFHVAWVWDYMNEQLIVKSVFLCITVQLLSALQDSQMQLKFKTSRYIHPSIQTSLHWDQERSLMGLFNQQLQMLNVNICTCSSLIPWYTSTTGLDIASSSLPPVQALWDQWGGLTGGKKAGGPWATQWSATVSECPLLSQYCTQSPNLVWTQHYLK